MKKDSYTAKTLDGEITYNKKDRSIILKNKKGEFSFDSEKMQFYKDHFKGCKSIYKPFVLLFWTDCNNGKQNNWNLI